MRSTLLVWLVAASLTAVPYRNAESQRPTTSEAQRALATRPELVATLRERIRTSGLTPDQIRARLRAEGYPESLLDAYLPGTVGTPTDVAATEDVFAAVRLLGIADSTDVSNLERSLRTGDTTMFDTLSGRADPLRRGERDPRQPSQRESRFPADSGYAVFGLELFRQATSQFEPNLAGPVDPSYRLGPGDQLVLILTGDVELSHSLSVTREGFVVIPQVGQLYVNNLTLQQLEDLLYTRLARVYSGVRRGPSATTRFHVSVSRLRTNQIFVVGDVERPGSYRVSSAGTVLTALYAAGGPTTNGSLRRISVKRGGKSIGELDLYAYLLSGDASRDVRLETGDIVFVPVHGPQVRVVGEVVRPATYEIRDDESLPDLIRAAGGFLPTASRLRVQIERIVPPAQRAPGGRDRIVIDIQSEQLASGNGPAFDLEAGDVVRVFSIAGRVRNRITVAGNVWSPGPQGFTPGMRLSQALTAAGGTKPDVYLGRIQIARLLPDSTRVQLHSAFRDSTGALTEDLALQEDDEIRVYSISEFRPRRYVAISGAVRKAGRFPYQEGMTLRDLVLQAGGLEESAYLQEAEIARLPESRAGGVTAKSVRVPLDSSYLFDRSPNGDYSGPPGLPSAAASRSEIVLQPYDNVLILRQPDWELQRTVFLGGEVRFPGRYALTSKTERLSDLIKRAGGLTSEAHADGVYFFRGMNRLGRIGIELPRVLKNPKDRDNLVLQHGDSIVIPAYSAVVNVHGAVNSPVAVAYAPGRSLRYYIEAAGGPTRRADVARAYVTQPNGAVESIRKRGILPDAVPHPRAGSSVYVPEKDPTDKRDYVGAAGAVAQILASLVAIIVVVSSR